MNLAGKEFRVRLADSGRVRCEPGWNLGPEWARGLRDYDLWFVWAGRGRMVTDDGAVELTPGAVFWMRPGRRYEAEQRPEARLGVTYIHFDLVTEEGAAAAWRVPPVEAMRTRQVDFVDLALRRVLALAGEPGGRGVAEALFGVVLEDLVRENSGAAGTAEAAGVEKHHREIVERAVARIRESPADAPPVADLARAAGYSVDHFSRIFARVVGEGPQEHVINARIERARLLLAESSLSVGMIAEALGFRDGFFFSRQFRQRTGRTPTEYRKGLRRGAP